MLSASSSDRLLVAMTVAAALVVGVVSIVTPIFGGEEVEPNGVVAAEKPAAERHEPQWPSQMSLHIREVN